MRHGFTLIEMSIVLVIIGLIIGGVTVGRDLIATAGLRAQIAQIEKYNAAANTFKGKYGYLPGDIPNPVASQYGFMARGSNSGEGDGDGVLEAGNPCGRYVQGGGETGMFWVDLSVAALLDGNFNTATSAAPPADMVFHTTDLDNYFPKARMGRGNYVYVWSGGYADSTFPCPTSDRVNYFGIGTIGLMLNGLVYAPSAGPGLTTQEAYTIDAKIDDALPQQGRVTALTATGGGSRWSVQGVGSFLQGAYNVSDHGPTTAATAGSSTTCYDNSASPNGTPGVAGTAQHYSVEMNNGTGNNCALSFRYQ